MKQMKAAIIQAYGNADSFEIVQIPIPDVGANEVLIKVAYAGINPADWKIREGYLSQFVQFQFPLVLGNDVSGVVEAVGENVTRFNPGDRVFGITSVFNNRPGAYAEYAVVNVNSAVGIPDSVNLQSAAVIPTAALTSWQGLTYEDRGNVQAGQRVLINGGSGGLGSYAVQFAKWIGAKVAATCGPANLDYVLSLGADIAIDYRNQDINEELTNWAPNGVDVILDTVGAKTLPRALDMIRVGGKLISVPTMQPDLDGDIQKEIAFAAKKGVTKTFESGGKFSSGKELEEIINLVTEGVVKAPSIEFFALDDVADAHKKVQDGHVRGKLALKIGKELS